MVDKKTDPSGKVWYAYSYGEPPVKGWFHPYTPEEREREICRQLECIGSAFTKLDFIEIKNKDK